MSNNFTTSNITMTGTKSTDYYTYNNDSAIFFKNSLKITPTNDLICMYYVIGGGGNGGAGGNPPNTADVGGGGGGGGQTVQGVIQLKKNIEYTITVGPSSSPSVITWRDGGYNQIIAYGGGYGNQSGLGKGGSKNDTNGTNYGNKKIISANPSTDGSNNSGGNGGTPGISEIPGIPVSIQSPGIGSRNSTDPGGDGGIGCGGGGSLRFLSSSVPRRGGGSGGKGGVFLVLFDKLQQIGDIETKMKELHQLPGTRVDQLNQQYNATMVAGAMWTVLATSLAYYVFTQL